MSLTPRPEHVSGLCLPGAGIPGVCDRCTTSLSPKGKRWCSAHCAHAYYADHIWKYARQAVIRRDRHTCAWCDVKGPVEVDHIEPALGHHHVHSCRHHRSNLRCLCPPCHKKRTAMQRAERDAARKAGAA